MIPTLPVLFACLAPASAQAHGEVLTVGLGPTTTLRSVSDAGDAVALNVRDSFYQTPYLWTENGGLRQLAVPAGFDSGDVRQMSAAGDRLVGSWSNDFSVQAVRWDALGQAELLEALDPSGRSVATAISADGSMTVGTAQDAHGDFHAVRWLASTSPEDLGTLGGSDSGCAAVSADGSTVVGSAQDATGIRRAFRWTAATGMQSVAPSGPGFDSTVTHISSDGTVLLGTVSRSGPDAIFRWTAATGSVVIATAASDDSQILGSDLSANGEVASFLELESFQGPLRSSYWSAATGVVRFPSDLGPTGFSADGSVVIGARSVNGVMRAYRWSPGTGREFLDSATPNFAQAWFITPDGENVIGLTRDYALTRWNARSEVGQRYCGSSVPNSTGQAGELVATGTNQLDFGSLRLEASSLPALTPGYFLASRTQGDVFPVAGSQGRLCLGGAIGRFVGPGQVQSSGAAGTISLTVPFDELPTPVGTMPGAPGDTWNFQCWHRDVNPGPTSNFTDAVRVILR